MYSLNQMLGIAHPLHYCKAGAGRGLIFSIIETWRGERDMTRTLRNRLFISNPSHSYSILAPKNICDKPARILISSILEPSYTSPPLCDLFFCVRRWSCSVPGIAILPDPRYEPKKGAHTHPEQQTLNGSRRAPDPMSWSTMATGIGRARRRRPLLLILRLQQRRAPPRIQRRGAR